MKFWQNKSSLALIKIRQSSSLFSVVYIFTICNLQLHIYNETRQGSWFIPLHCQLELACLTDIILFCFPANRQKHVPS